MTSRKKDLRTEPNARATFSNSAQTPAQSALGVSTSELAAKAEKLNFQLVEVKDEAMLQEWFDLQHEIFTDPSDLEPWDMIVERFHAKDDQGRPINQFTMLKDTETGEWAGMRLLQTDPNVPGVAYCPWGGITDDYRGKAVYPLMAKLTLAQLADRGVFIALADIEDKERVHVAYPDDPESAVETARKRENYFRRSGYHVVANSGDVQYVRPPSEEGEEYSGVQAYDLLAFFIAPENEEKAREILCPDGSPLFMNPEKTELSRTAYSNLYLAINQLQYGAESEQNLRGQYKAINHFYETMERNPDQKIHMNVGGVNSRTNPEADIHMEIS